MKLCYSPGACSLSPHIVAKEAGLPFELSRVTFNGAERTTAEGENFFEVNPRGGYVPTMRLDDGSVLIEGPAIIQYLADKAPSKHLLPEHGSRAYYDPLSWVTFISTEIHKTFSALYNPAISEGDKAFVIEKLKKRFAVIEGVLAGKEYFLGKDYSIADAYAYTILRWTKRFKIELAPFPNIMAFMQRMESRPAVAEALKEEGIDPIAN